MNQEEILRILRKKGYVPTDIHGLRKTLKLTPRQQPKLQSVLREMEKEGLVARIKGDRYAPPIEADLVPGRIRINRRGKGTLHPEDPAAGPIAIPQDMTQTALDGDKVLVRRETPASAPEQIGRVTKILERARTQTCGTLQKSNQFFFVIPDDPRIPHDIYVPAHPKAKIGEKVVVKLSEWTARQLNPEGVIVEVLGPPDAQGVDMLSILKQYELPAAFPPQVLHAVKSLPSVPDHADYKNRLDCREHLVITIDPDDAKDFDDALYLETAPKGGWKLWVHIADVSHYVKPGTPLDREAMERGNSTYLVDRVIPMLPEKLSNGLCSLRPGEDRLTKCAEFTLDADARVLGVRFHSAVIHSKRRFTYQEAMAVLQKAPVTQLEQMLHGLNKVARKLRAERMRHGSLDMDFPERKIRLDDQGDLLRLEIMLNDESHQLVEECMLLANDAVAARLKATNVPAIYRIHDAPDPSKLNDLREELLAHGVACGDLSKKKELQGVLQKLKNHPAGDALRIRLLRSMRRACYSTQPLGHYGLAKNNYTHFTSPIRRYADLLVHRALFEPKARALSASLRGIADHISRTERVSSDAEQDSKTIKIYSALHRQLQSKAAIAYEGMVTEVRNFGFFVEIAALGVSGLVPLSSDKSEFYHFDQARSRLVGRRTKRVIKSGDKVRVKVFKVDFFKKQVDFCLAAP